MSSATLLGLAGAGVAEAGGAERAPRCAVSPPWPAGAGFPSAPRGARFWLSGVLAHCQCRPRPCPLPPGSPAAPEAGLPRTRVGALPASAWGEPQPAAREPRAAPPRTGRHRVAPRTARGHAFFLLSMARTTWLFWDTAGNALFFWSVLCVFCVGFFFLFKLCHFPSASLVPSVVESRCSPFVLARVSPAFAQRGLGGGGGRRVLGPGPRSASLTKAPEQAPRTRAPAAGPPHGFS